MIQLGNEYVIDGQRVVAAESQNSAYPCGGCLFVPPHIRCEDLEGWIRCHALIFVRPKTKAAEQARIKAVTQKLTGADE